MLVQETALTMIHTIREAFNELLADNHWMDDETRAVAKEKANAMNERIGYPQFITTGKELIKEYDNVNIFFYAIFAKLRCGFHFSADRHQGRVHDEHPQRDPVRSRPESEQT